MVLGIIILLVGLTKSFRSESGNQVGSAEHTTEKIPETLSERAQAADEAVKCAFTPCIGAQTGKRVQIPTEQDVKGIDHDDKEND